MRTLARLGTLFACCLWGAIGGWAVALAAAQPEPPPGPTLLAYGAVTLFCGGYLLGSWIRGRTPSVLALRAAALTAVAALAAKALVPGLAAWVAVLIAAAVSAWSAGSCGPTVQGGSPDPSTLRASGSGLSPSRSDTRARRRL